MKILLIIAFCIWFVLDSRVRYTLLHPHIVIYNAIADLYNMIKYKKYNEFKEYGKLIMFIADELNPFGSGKTLNMVAYAKAVYEQYNGLMIWSKYYKGFVKQQIKILSNIELFNIPYVPLVNEQQIIDLASNEDDSIVWLVLLDEMGSLYNNRDWKTNLSSDMINGILQIRKGKVAILGTVQSWSLFDATIRKVTSLVRSCRKTWRYLVVKEYLACDIERSQFNLELINTKSVKCNFATDSLYNSYNTNERVERLQKDIQEGKMLTSEEVLNSSSGQSTDIESLTNIKRRYRKRFKK